MDLYFDGEEMMEERWWGVDFFENDKLFGIKNWIMVIVLLLFVKGISKVRLKGRWYFLLNFRYWRSDFGSSVISGEIEISDVNLLYCIESEKLEDYCSEVLLDISESCLKGNDICLKN